jgi:hypothetical protein
MAVVIRPCSGVVDLRMGASAERWCDCRRGLCHLNSEMNLLCQYHLGLLILHLMLIFEAELSPTYIVG